MKVDRDFWRGSGKVRFGVWEEEQTIAIDFSTLNGYWFSYGWIRNLHSGPVARR